MVKGFSSGSSVVEPRLDKALVACSNQAPRMILMAFSSEVEHPTHNRAVADSKSARPTKIKLA